MRNHEIKLSNGVRLWYWRFGKEFHVGLANETRAVFVVVPDRDRDAFAEFCEDAASTAKAPRRKTRLTRAPR